MSLTDLFTLLPFIILAAASVLVMLAAAFRRSHTLSCVLTLTGLALSFGSLFAVLPFSPRQVTSLLVVDRYALFYTGLIISASFASVVFAHGYLRQTCGRSEEFYLLLLLATTGATVLTASTHFASFFLGLEILSVSLYALIAYPLRSERHVEAGVKYLMLAAFSSAFLLFGMALIYAESGTMDFVKLASWTVSRGGIDLPEIAGFAMIIIGIGFKLAVVPFHMWTPDVYEGAPVPVTAYIATVSKGAVFSLLLRYFTKVEVHAFGPLFLLFTVIALSSMVMGNLLALYQNNVKRILAYSSIAHLGYLLVAFQSTGAVAAMAIAFYLTGYFIATVMAFGVITVFSGSGREAEDIEDYRGLAWRRPWLSAVFTAALLSLAGLPLTAGFIGKFYIAAAAVGSFIWLQVIVLAGTSAIGLFYYLRVINVMYSARGQNEPAHMSASYFSLPAGVLLAVLTSLLVLLGVYPSPLLEIIGVTAGRLP